jgi:putative oxidoreductase
MNSSLTTSQSGAELIFSDESLLGLAGRMWIGATFVFSGLAAFIHCGDVGTHVPLGGVLSVLLHVSMGFEVFASCALIIGWRVRTVAGLLACFSMLSALIFHNDVTDPTQMLLFLNNIAIAGGLLFLTANGVGARGRDNHLA